MTHPLVSHTEVNNRFCGILRVDDHGVLVNDLRYYRHVLRCDTCNVIHGILPASHHEDATLGI